MQKKGCNTVAMNNLHDLNDSVDDCESQYLLFTRNSLGPTGYSKFEIIDQ